jgi:hypothetical protein
VFQELMDYFPAVRELSPVWKFYEHFRNASIAPADPLLNYREVGYWSTDPLYDRKFRDAPRDSYLERFTTIVVRT